MASLSHVKEKPIDHENHQSHQQQQRQPVLKCPRCDSSNTKFCYYNNYSLSQPRHFCKACKRYWTRGGTLRNVPVGGGCRKNKRSIKTTTFTKQVIGHHSIPNPNLDHSTQVLTNPNPLSGLLQQNHKYPRFSDHNDISRYDHLIQSQVSSFGLGFSLPDSTPNNSTPIISSSYPSMFNGLITTSSFEQPQSIMGFESYGDGVGSVMNDGQMEGTKSNIVWNNIFNGENDNDQIKGVESSDPAAASFLWTISGSGGDGGEWLDPTTSSTICSPSSLL